MPLACWSVWRWTQPNIYFEKKEFDKALIEVIRVNYNYFVFKFDVRILTLKIYYELNSFEPALSLIDSFSHFLINNKSAESYRESFLAFLKFVREMVRLKSGSDKKEAAEIKKEILNTKTVLSRNWLLEKAEELYLVKS